MEIKNTTQDIEFDERYKNGLRAILAVLSTGVILLSVFSYYKKHPTTIVSKVEGKKYIKSEFKNSTPSDFIKEIPLPKDVSFEQSYGLQYESAKQLTVVFATTKTRKENFELYKNFLSNNKWTVKNNIESKSISSMYAVKENNDINITISDLVNDKTNKSQVSISVLRR